MWVLPLGMAVALPVTADRAAGGAGFGSPGVTSRLPAPGPQCPFGLSSIPARSSHPNTHLPPVQARLLRPQHLGLRSAVRCFCCMRVGPGPPRPFSHYLPGPAPLARLRTPFGALFLGSLRSHRACSGPCAASPLRGSPRRRRRSSGPGPGRQCSLPQPAPASCRGSIPGRFVPAPLRFAVYCR